MTTYGMRLMILRDERLSRQTQRAGVLEMLDTGPGTSGDLSAETGIPLRQMSAILSTLHRQRRVDRRAMGRGYVYSRRQA